ncbi:MAG: MltA domain-containing protein, partial [Rhodomicrobium sp.]|nr:MltA domain-containing protein [Rhodomicrobium sp.]
MPADGQNPLWRWQHARAEAAPASFEPVDFSAIPGWADDDHRAALDCYLQSAGLTGQPLPAQDIQALLTDCRKARAFFEESFAAFRIVEAPGLLTAYFEPVLKGSRKQSPAFPVPVYRRPPALVPLPEGHVLRDLNLTAARETP